VIGRLLLARARRRLRALERAGREAGAIQRRTLLRLVRRAARTRFGRAHGFAEIRTIADYRARVPLQDYASLTPYLERARDRSPDETWPGVPAAFAMTSGTTGGDKYLPQTAASLRSSLRGGGDAFAAYLARAGDAWLGRGRIAFLGGSVALQRLPSGIPWGDNTGILAARAPLWTLPFRAPSRAVLGLGDWEVKLEAAARDLAHRNVRVLLGVPSWSVLLLDAVERAAGTSIRDVWPAWKGYIHGGMNFAPYASTFRKRAGAGIVFVDTYSATEGGMLAVQDRSDDAAMAVLPDRNVCFELVPADDPDGPRLLLDEVEVGVPYLVAVTTEAGLWSYRIGDVVRFTSVRPPRLLFVGRQRFFLNAFGEHVSQEELERAAAAAASVCRCEVREFAVLPEYPDARRTSGRHVWIVEFAQPPEDVERFARALDGEIARGNADYRAHRTGDVQLRPPAVRLVRAGTFYDWMKARGRLGGQHKVPRVLDPQQASRLLR